MGPLRSLAFLVVLTISVPSSAVDCGDSGSKKIPEGLGSWKVPGLEQIQKTKSSPTNVAGEFSAELFVFNKPVLVRTGSLEVVTPDVVRRITEPEDVIVISRMTALSIRGRNYAYVTELRITRFVPQGWKPIPPPPRADGRSEPAMGGVFGCVVGGAPTYVKGPGPLMLAYVDSNGDGTFDRVFQTWTAIDTPNWVKSIGGESPFEPFSRAGSSAGLNLRKSVSPIKFVDPSLPKLAKP